jgi:RNA polymerase sigma-70 factor (ECF subfamily)
VTEGQPLPPEDQAFRQTLVEIIPSLRAFARGLCGNRDLADDLAQEALAKAWAARASFTAGTNFKAWIFRILRNHFYTTANVARRFVLMDPHATADLVSVPPAQGSERAVRDIMAGLATLPPPQREALMLLESGLHWDEIAMIAGCPIGTIKSRITRGRAALRLYLEGPPGSSMAAATDHTDA